MGNRIVAPSDTGTIAVPLVPVGEWALTLELTIPAGRVGEALTDWPLYISGATLPVMFWNVVRNDGYDVRFRDAAGTVLAYDRPHFSYAGQAGEWHVKVPSVSPIVDNVLYIDCGKPTQATDLQSAAAVWTNSYAGVWHLGESAAGTGTAGVYKDSLGAYSGADYVDPGGKTGKLYASGGETFDGGDFIVPPAALGAAHSGAAGLTFSTWYQRTGGDGTERRIFMSQCAVGMARLIVNLTTANKWYVGVRAVSTDGLQTVVTTPAYTDSNWHHLAAAVNVAGDAITVYVDGAPVEAPGTPAWTATTFNNEIGNAAAIGSSTGGGSYWFIGLLDEMRLANGVRSAAWIAAEYNNQSSPGTFYSVA